MHEQQPRTLRGRQPRTLHAQQPRSPTTGQVLLARALSLPYHGSGATGTSSLAPLPRVRCYRHELSRSPTTGQVLPARALLLPYHGSGATGTSSLAPQPRVSCYWHELSRLPTTGLLQTRNDRCYRHELSRSPTTGLSRTCATGAILRMSSLAVLPRSARPIVLTLTFSHTRSLRPVHEPMIYVSELASFLA